MFAATGHLDGKTHSSSPSLASSVKPLAILATVDLRPKPMDAVPTTATESQTLMADEIPRPAQVSWVSCYQ